MKVNIFEVIVAPLKYLDPSLFQVVIIGILTIYIPLVIARFSEIAKLEESGKERRAEFYKIVFNEEVLDVRAVFWSSVLGLASFGFFARIEEIPLGVSIPCILILVILILSFRSHLFKMLKFSEGKELEHAKNYLKRLRFSAPLRDGNKEMREKIKEVWGLVLSEEIVNEDFEFADLFVGQVNDAINNGQYWVAKDLADIYIDNTKKDRIPLNLHHGLVRKSLEWNEKLQFEIPEKEDNRIIKFEGGYFLDWYYFGDTLFTKMVTALMKDSGVWYIIFEDLKEHVEKYEKEWKEAGQGEEWKKYHGYIVRLLGNFYRTFFDGMCSLENQDRMWKNYFPDEWKIKSENSDNLPSLLAMIGFINWYRENKSDTESFDSGLSRLVNGLFPKADQTLFPAFVKLAILGGGNVENALSQKLNFRTGSHIDEMIWLDGDVTGSLKEKEDTVRMIFNYLKRFQDKWRLITLYTNEMEPEENENWENLSEEEKKAIYKRVVGDKLLRLGARLESAEVQNMTEGDELKEQNRKDFIELVDAMHKYIKE